ncbi:hypothetical protein CTAYLR_007209 [Chrysophaeum taylorii]|uniref:BRCT domain-containing protein n=1 Tax=Chrysophaeum taylorii TaxID=2483200 RepID=A0AAD7XTS3_9STRA|nr:hypothetical protein CTAYLR_007209 [Chrysophaeum taylorii]
MQLNGESLGLRRSRVLAGARLTSTGLEKEVRCEMERLAKELGARWSAELTEKTTHLIAATANSDKYRAATRPPLENEVIVATPAWVRACHETVTRRDPSEFGLPPLAGIVVCVTNYALEQRDAFEERVEALGGTFGGSLERGRTTHLVANEAMGSKFEHARAWGLPIVDARWLEACEASGRCLDASNFSVCLPAVVVAEPRVRRQQEHPAAPPTLLGDKLAALDETLADAEPSRVFASCRFYIHGTTRDILLATDGWLKCLRLINMGLGAVYPTYFGRNIITHVLVPPDAEPLPRTAKHKTYKDARDLVNANWLAQSLLAQTLLDTLDFKPVCV